MDIRVDDLTSNEITHLLQVHQDDMLTHSPPKSVHTLDLIALKSPSITFWSAWSEGKLAGCGALKEIDDSHAELKSVRTSNDHLRKGVAAKLVDHILTTAKKRSYKKVSLETGNSTAFLPAKNLYKKLGFKDCQPFADYNEDPFSSFMTKDLTTMS
jgi:putative acetyltransferase